MEAAAVTRFERRASLLPRSETRPAHDRVVRSEAIALIAASLVTACLLATANEAPLPALGWAAAFVFLAVERDVREQRIPNWLTFPAFGLALAHGAYAGGLAGLLASLLGAGLALALLLGPYLAGWFGAGDVKAMIVLGALWGAGILFPVLTWALVVGGGLALAWVALRGGLAELLGRWWGSLALTLSRRRWTYLPPEPGSPAAGGIPFAVAIGLGAAAHQLWGTPWS